MGAINIKHTEGGNDVTLSSDGTNLLLDGTSVGSQPFTTPEVKIASWSVTNADKGKVFIVDTDNLTLTLPDKTTLDDDWFIRLYTKGNSFQPSYGVVGDLTIDPQYSTFSGRVNGNTNWIMRSRQGGILFNDPEQASNYIFDVHSTTWDIDVHSTANANRANATGWGSIAISGQATASATGSIAIGYLSTASGTDSVAIGGNSAQATATDAIAIGTSLANAANGIAIGINNSTTSYGATATNGIAIGQLAKAPTADGIAIGRNTNANNGAIAIGYNSYTTSVRGVAVGYDTNAGYQAASFGYGNSATGNFSLTVGHSNTASHINSAAIGYGVQTTAAYQVALGGSTQTVRISETYTLPATDGTTGQVLTTDGTGAVTFETPATPTFASLSEVNAADLDVHDIALQAKTTFVVTANGTASYRFDTNDVTDNPTIYVRAGETIAFDLTALGGAHPFQIETDGGVSYDVGLVHIADDGTRTTGALAQGNASGTLYWKVPASISGTYEYQCTSHIGMNGIIQVEAAEGESGLSLYAENPVTPTAPITTGTNAVAIGDGASAETSQSISIGYSSRAYGNTGALALGYNTTAFGIGATAIGYDSVVNGGNYAVAMGRSFANGGDSFAAAIANNTSTYGATGTSSVAMGYRAKAAANCGLALGYNALANGNGSVAISTSAWSGQGAAAEAQGSIVIGNQVFSGAVGYYSINIGTDIVNTQRDAINLGKEIKNDTKGKFVWGNGQFSASGDSQSGSFILRSETTDATPKALTANHLLTADATNQIVLPNNSAYGFTGIIVAREAAASTDDFAVWEIKGGAVRGATAATTALGTYNINKISESAGAANWSIALSADTTNGAVAITVTGEAAHNIRWVATINTSEVTY